MNGKELSHSGYKMRLPERVSFCQGFPVSEKAWSYDVWSWLFIPRGIWIPSRQNNSGGWCSRRTEFAAFATFGWKRSPITGILERNPLCFRYTNRLKVSGRTTYHSVIVPIFVSGLRKICRRTDPKKQTLYQVSEWFTPRLDIGKGCPEICRSRIFFVSCSKLFEMRYLNTIGWK